jgi:starch synthase
MGRSVIPGTIGRVSGQPIRVAILAAECEPWAKTGGLADVVDALARSLGRLGDAGRALHAPVDVFLPRYRSVPAPRDARAEPPLEIADPAGGAPLTVSILDAAADGYRLRLVDHAPAFDRDALYDHPDDPWRFAVFCRAALAALRRDPVPPDVLHLNDWHTAPALLERARGEAVGDAFLGRVAVLATVHNLAYHGWTPAARLGELGLRQGEPLAGTNPDGIDLLLTAIERSDLVNTVSPRFAREALTPEFGMGLDGALRARGDRFFGILNGLDPDTWDPAHDPALAAAYDRKAPWGKAACRRDLLARLAFDPADEGAVLAMIGRLDTLKGFDILAGALPALVDAGVRVVVQGRGEATLADPFRALAAAAPDRVALVERFDRDMARRIYAGADLFAMPSRAEPCGLSQMIALRYGTPPVVHRVGGLADTVVDADEDPARGTGFVFDGLEPDELTAAVRRACAMRATDPAAWATLLARGMAADFGWDRTAAPAYLAAYRRAIALRRG